jgi:hypothetical protein
MVIDNINPKVMIVPIHHVHETWHHGHVWHISMELEKECNF